MGGSVRSRRWLAAGAAGCGAGLGSGVGSALGALVAAFGETSGDSFFARKYCRPKKTATRTSIMTSSDRLSPPPC